MYLMDDFCIMCNNVTVSALVPNKKGNLSRLLSTPSCRSVGFSHITLACSQLSKCERSRYTSSLYAAYSYTVSFTFSFAIDACLLSTST
jgi:hypothetical protein